MARATAFALVVLCLGALSPALAQPAPSPAAYSTVAEAVQANSDLTYLLAAVQATGLTGILANSSLAYTILAPNNDAFEDVLEEANVDVEAFLADPGLTSILGFHIIPAVATSSDLEDGAEIPTLLGETLTVSITGDEVTFVGLSNNATVLTADIQAGESIIHIIDTVLIPSQELDDSAPAQAPNLALAEQTLGIPSASTAVAGRKLLQA